MSEVILKNLSIDEFDSEKYVHEISQQNVGGLSLQDHRQKIQQLSELTNAQLKKNVYINYMQFIDTAKEISYLESEMYQLSHLITEQKSLLTSLLESSISGEKGPGSNTQEMIEVNPVEIREKKEKENRKKLTALLEKVEGCSHVIDVPDRHLIYDTDLVELNCDDYSANQRVHLYLLNDSLMIATWLSDRRGPIRYKFEKLCPLDQVLPVNIKDRGSTKNAFKLLLFPDPRVFHTPSKTAKENWLDEIERAKNNKINTEKRRLEVKEKNEQKQLESLESNPFSSDEESLSNPFLPTQLPVATWGPPEWICELPEDLDQAIHQRNFEAAVQLIDKGREFFDTSEKNPKLTEMRRDLENRVENLVDVLVNELTVTPEKSLQGGPRAVRRATTLLVHLNRSSQACDLFLKFRSAVLKWNLKLLKIEGETKIYVKKLCSIFFHNILSTANEFKKAFPNAKSVSSAFVTWANEELHVFHQIFSRHVFTSQSSFNVVAECVQCADKQCQQLSSVGLDFTFIMRGLLLNDVSRVIKESRDQLLDAIKRRSQEDAWKCMNFDSKENCEKFVESLKDVGIVNLSSYISANSLEIELTSSSLQFTKSFLSFFEDVMKIFWPITEQLIDDVIGDVFGAQIKHCSDALDDSLFKNRIATIRRVSAFLLDVVLSVCEFRYGELTSHSHPKLHTFHTLRPALMRDK